MNYKIKYKTIDNNKIKLIPFIQPIYNYKFQVFGYEVLLRCIYENNIYPPNFCLTKFNKNSNNLALKISFYRKIFNKTLHSKKNYFINLNLNLFQIDFFINFFLNELKKRKNKNLVFEILENNKINKHNYLFLKKINNKYHYKLAIDDLISCYSDFKRLNLLSEYIFFLKIDGNLIKNIKQKKELKIFKKILRYANIHKKKIILEHIENKNLYLELLKIIEKNNFDKKNVLMQGFYFGKPIPL